jgi:hypothetical protein
MGTVNIEGLDKAEVLAALYFGSRAQGMGWFAESLNLASGGTEWGETVEAARAWLAKTGYVEYFGGRVIKMGFDSEEVGTGLYDRDNGTGAGYKAIAALYAGKMGKPYPHADDSQTWR